MNNSTCSRRSLVKGMAGAAAFAIVGGLGLAGCGDPRRQGRWFRPV